MRIQLWLQRSLRRASTVSYTHLYTKFPTSLEDTLQGAEILGYSMQDTMDIEAVMNVDPDLIIISTVQEKMYDQLSESAPTVMIQLEALNWKEDIRTLAQVFGREDAADQWISSYEEKAKEAGEAVRAASVSYTHLDVYKRQVKDNRGAACI